MVKRLGEGFFLIPRYESETRVEAERSHDGGMKADFDECHAGVIDDKNFDSFSVLGTSQNEPALRRPPQDANPKQLARSRRISFAIRICIPILRITLVKFYQRRI